MTETTAPTNPTTARRRTAALWLGAACVAAMAYIVARSAWIFLYVFFVCRWEPLGWFLLDYAWLAGLLGGWWAAAKWMGGVGLCPSLSAWWRRWTALGIVVGVMAAMFLFAFASQLFAIRWGWTQDRLVDMWATSGCDTEIPQEEYFVDPETGEPLVAHTETINVRAGFDLPSGDAELARTAWRMAGDDGAEPPEPPNGAPEEE